MSQHRYIQSGGYRWDLVKDTILGDMTILSIEMRSNHIVVVGTACVWGFVP